MVVSNGAEALDYLLGEGNYVGRDLSDAPVMVLMDLNLPKIAGLDVIKRIREDKRTSLTPVVIMTDSKANQDYIKRSLPGGHTFICKPINFDELAEAIRNLHLHWLVLN